MAQKAHETTFLERFNAALTVHLGADAMSPTKVGEFLGVNKQTAARWLAGGKPTPPMLYRIADKTQVNARWLIADEGTMEPPLTLSQEENDAIVQIFRVLKRNQKALRKWLRDGHELVELSTPASPNNPYGKG